MTRPITRPGTGRLAWLPGTTVAAALSLIPLHLVPAAALTLDARVLARSTPVPAAAVPA